MICDTVKYDMLVTGHEHSDDKLSNKDSFTVFPTSPSWKCELLG